MVRRNDNQKQIAQSRESMNNYAKYTGVYTILTKLFVFGNVDNVFRTFWNERKRCLPNIYIIYNTS